MSKHLHLKTSCASPKRARLRGTSGPTRARSRTLAPSARGASPRRAPLRRTSGRTPAKSPTLAQCAQEHSATRATLRRTSGPTPAKSPTLAFTAARRSRKVGLPANTCAPSTQELRSYARVASRPPCSNPPCSGCKQPATTISASRSAPSLRVLQIGTTHEPVSFTLASDCLSASTVARFHSEIKCTR